MYQKTKKRKLREHKVCDVIHFTNAGVVWVRVNNALTMIDTPELKRYSVIQIKTMIANQNLEDLERFLVLNTKWPDSPRYSSQIYFDFLCCLMDLERVLFSE